MAYSPAERELMGPSRRKQCHLADYKQTAVSPVAHILHLIATTTGMHVYPFASYVGLHVVCLLFRKEHGMLICWILWSV